jgi:hypothetical protein
MVKRSPKEVEELALMGAAASSGKEPSSSFLTKTKRSSIIHGMFAASADEIEEDGGKTGGGEGEALERSGADRSMGKDWRPAAAGANSGRVVRVSEVAAYQRKGFAMQFGL